MNWEKFADYHSRALRLNEVEHGVLLNVLSGGEHQYWNFGSPGACAAQSPDRAIVLGKLDEPQCRLLAEQALMIYSNHNYPSILGSGLRAHWFANRAAELGITFRDAEPQQIYVLTDPPVIPKISGTWRHIQLEETELFISWLAQFAHEAMPFEPVPTHDQMEEIAHTGRYIFWEDKGVPTSMAGITRDFRTSTAITGVYTPLEHRGHGYAGAVTAALAERIISNVKVATLYTDLRNPASNKCYSRIGFKPAYASFHFHR
jgi:predicted GNAT family acetyltransferase